MTHQELRELLPAYALDALTEAEHAEVDRHLPGCDECRREIAAFREVTTGLATAAVQVVPPAALRETVLDAVRPRRAAGERPRRWLMGAALAAAAAVIVILAGVSLSLNQQLAALRGRLDAQEQVLALLAAPTARSTILTGSVEANVRFVFDPATKQGALVVTDLRDPGDEFVYQLWLVAGTEPRSAGVFRPIPGRPIILPVAADFTRFQAVAISVERAPNGALQPTRAPILSGTI